jgi:hypothetical protein
MFATFKLFGGMLCFFANCLIMVKSGSIEDVIKDYIAVEIISNIDNLMAATVTGDDVVPEMSVYLTLDRFTKTDGELLEDYIFDILPAKKGAVVASTEDADKADKDEMQVIEASVDGNFEERLPWNQKCFYLMGMMLYRALAVFYCGYYYYFAPFTVNALIIYS